MRLEQARSAQPSGQVLSSLARALRLSEDERDHLYLLAGHRRPAVRFGGAHVRPGLLYVLDQLEGTPAQILNDLGDVLVQNPMAEALLGCVCTVTGRDRNIIWRWFTDPETREPYPPQARADTGRMHAADLRAAAVRRGDDAASRTLIDDLHDASGEFARLWERHEVASRSSSRMYLRHPLLGEVELDVEPLLTPAEDQRMHIFTPPPGGAGHAVLAMLRDLDPALSHLSHETEPNLR